MPQAILAVAGSAATAISGAVYTGLTSVGVSAGTAALASTYAASITAVSVATLAYVGPSLLFAPNIPSPEFGRSVKRQPIPDRVSGYGRARIGGAYMLYETDGTNEGLALNVFAMHDGLIAGWNEIYLNDQVVTVGVDTYVETGPDLRYGKFGDLVRIETRLGEPTETNYSAVTAARASVWPSNARGDGIASLMMIAKAKEKEQFTRDYPNGLPLPSAVGDLQYCWDPRLGGRGTITDDADKAASATWVGGSRNPILHLLDYMTNEATGLGFPLSRFLPNIAAWEAAADTCDEAVALAAGGTVPRYQAGGTYLHSTAPADVIATILATCDGWMTQDATGCFTVQAGEYIEPTVTITEAHIVSLSRQFYREDEKATNEIVVSYTDPAFDYTEVETTPWRIEADIAARDDQVRSQRLSLPWVQNNSQARRLAKIAARKATAPISGTLTTTLDGLRAWSERRIRIQAPSDGEAMADIVVDILPLTLNPDMTVSIPFVSCDPTAYDWTTAEETTGAGDDVRPPPEPIGIPVISSVEPFYEAGLTRLRIFIDDGELGATYAVRWRIAGDDAWTREADQIAEGGGSVFYVETGGVPDVTIEVEIAYVAAGGTLSDWSSTASTSSLYGPGGNLLAYPEDFSAPLWALDSGGTGVIPVVGPDLFAAPDETISADEITFDRGDNFSRISQSASTVNGQLYEFGVWLKALTPGASIALRLDGANSGTLTLTSDWVRYTFTATAGASPMHVQLILFASISGSPSTAVVHAWGAQLRPI